MLADRKSQAGARNIEDGGGRYASIRGEISNDRSGQDSDVKVGAIFYLLLEDGCGTERNVDARTGLLLERRDQGSKGTLNSDCGKDSQVHIVTITLQNSYAADWVQSWMNVEKKFLSIASIATSDG